jgi:hypothetical protein
MAIPLTPIPNQPVGDTHEWRDWFFQVYNQLGSQSAPNLWNNINFAGSNITSIQIRQHNSLQGLQGGDNTGTEYYHLSNAQYTILSAIPSGISATIATAKLTTGGVNGSMTFVNGILTTQTQAT